MQNNMLKEIMAVGEASGATLSDRISAAKGYVAGLLSGLYSYFFGKPSAEPTSTSAAVDAEGLVAGAGAGVGVGAKAEVRVGDVIDGYRLVAPAAGGSAAKWVSVEAERKKDCATKSVQVV